jgi:dTDP-4-dehydrorhamnose reductase
VTILLTGAAGQLGQELLPRLSQLGEVFAVDRSALPGVRNLHVQDLGDLNQVEILLNRVRPDAIVNAAAYTAVDLAEENSELAFQVNQGLPERLAQWCSLNNRMLFHYSTDYVFSGKSDRPYVESDPTGPLGVYGESKLAGERSIAQSGCGHVILRTSWVYSGHGNNFLLTMLKLARSRPSLSIVDDQVGRPTWARNLAQVTAKLMGQLLSGSSGARPSGTYHYCDHDVVSWYEFAKEIFSVALDMGLLESAPQTLPVPSAEFPQKAERPLYSVLDTARIENECGVSPAGLRKSLASCIREISEND